MSKPPAEQITEVGFESAGDPEKAAEQSVEGRQPTECVLESAGKEVEETAQSQPNRPRSQGAIPTAAKAVHVLHTSAPTTYNIGGSTAVLHVSAAAAWSDVTAAFIFGFSPMLRHGQSTSQPILRLTASTISNKKARLLAQGYEKEYGPYYAETSRSVRLLKMVPFAPAYIQRWPNSHPS
ncbi:Hypothetical predicted protein [Olea europaea subsp. europaea]|uniref:Uncharacterized protein n=1 Tax=Olea europaea subsp. europaea TaxID=158383 RepID=A0A8S0PY16_OLEEU|nr:Hypothetical predicted protein [Olea europaea subsp. europaea]